MLTSIRATQNMISKMGITSTGIIAEPAAAFNFCVFKLDSDMYPVYLAECRAAEQKGGRRPGRYKIPKIYGLVCDIGGGTTDISIVVVEVINGQLTIRCIATTGTVYILPCYFVESLQS
jgi:molecular chaperone DnaK (HSP70)